MAINWKQGKQVTTIKPNQTMIVFLYKKGSKEIHKIISGICKISVYENIDTSKFGCIRCGKPFDKKKNFIKHWIKNHGKRPIFKKHFDDPPVPKQIKPKKVKWNK